MVLAADGLNHKLPVSLSGGHGNLRLVWGGDGCGCGDGICQVMMV